MYPKEYIDYLVHFHGDRDYFECHEILEDYWKSVDKNNKGSILVAFILLAVSNYHHRRNNLSGAARTLQKAITIFNNHKHQLHDFGFSQMEFIDCLKERLSSIQNAKGYKSMNLPLNDPELLTLCMKVCNQKGYTWGQNSDLSNEDIVHRHVKRDRSEVILERNLALSFRHKKGRE